MKSETPRTKPNDGDNTRIGRKAQLVIDAISFSVATLVFVGALYFLRGFHFSLMPKSVGFLLASPGLLVGVFVRTALKSWFDPKRKTEEHGEARDEERRRHRRFQEARKRGGGVGGVF